MPLSQLSLLQSGVFLVYLNQIKNHSLNKRHSKWLTFRQHLRALAPYLLRRTVKVLSLKKSKSNIDYSRNGHFVLNNDSVIGTTNEEANALNQLIIPYGNQSRVGIIDSTCSLAKCRKQCRSYLTLFKDKTREVLLFGEAFLKYPKNPEKPFIVKTSDLEIKVSWVQSLMFHLIRRIMRFKLY